MKQILTKEQLEQKIKRISYEIYENNFEEQELVIFGIDGGGSGYLFAQSLMNQLNQICDIKTSLVKVSFNKLDANPKVEFDFDLKQIQNKTVLIVDDVLNTARTIMNTVVELMDFETKKIQVAVVINRKYLKFPIKANYIGYSISTMIDEHVRVQIEGENIGVFVG